jgi:hypothetical protein
MELVIFILEHAISFIIASIPFVVAFLLLKKTHVHPRYVFWCIVLILVISLYFWVRICDIKLILYQSISYVTCLLWCALEWILNRVKKQE